MNEQIIAQTDYIKYLRLHLDSPSINWHKQFSKKTDRTRNTNYKDVLANWTWDSLSSEQKMAHQYNNPKTSTDIWKATLRMYQKKT